MGTDCPECTSIPAKADLFSCVRCGVAPLLGYSSPSLAIEPLAVAITTPLPEWAFDESEIRELQSDGLSGEDVRVCMVDTGVSLTHTALGNADVEFKDFVWQFNRTCGLWFDFTRDFDGWTVVINRCSNRYRSNVTLGMAAALSADGENNTGSETRVAEAYTVVYFRVRG